MPTRTRHILALLLAISLPLGTPGVQAQPIPPPSAHAGAAHLRITRAGKASTLKAQPALAGSKSLSAAPLAPQTGRSGSTSAKQPPRTPRTAASRQAALERHVDYLAMRHIYLPHFESKNVRWGFWGRSRKVKQGLNQAEQRLVKVLSALENQHRITSAEAHTLKESLSARLEGHYRRTGAQSLWDRLPLRQGKRFPDALPVASGTPRWWRWLQRATHLTVRPYSKMELLIDGPMWRKENRKLIRGAKGHLHIASWGWHYDEQGRWYATELMARKLGMSPRSLARRLKREPITQIRDRRLARRLAKVEKISAKAARLRIATMTEEQRQALVGVLLEPLKVRVLLGSLIQGVQMRAEQFKKTGELHQKVLTDLEAAGIEVVLDNKLFSSKTPMFRLENAWAVVPHAKLVITEGTALTGGMNIGNHYLQPRGQRLDWHDAAVRVKGELVGELDQSFVERWNRAMDNEGRKDRAIPAAHRGEGLVLYNPNRDAKDGRLGSSMVVGTGVAPGHGKTTYSYRTALMMALAGTKDRFELVTPYLTSPLLVKQLVRTAHRLRSEGKDPSKLRVTITGTTDTPLTGKLVTGHLIHLLQQAGVTVRYWQPDPAKSNYTKYAIHHAKSWISDDKVAYIGSANGTVRSLVQDWEMGLLVDDPGFIKKLNRELFQKDRQFTAPPKAQPALKRAAGHAVALLFGPILRLL